jgi:hypothetical protein
VVSTKSQTHKELGIWVADQRQLDKRITQGKSPKGSGIFEERIRLLNDLGFVWDLQGYKWQKMYQDVVDYTEQHGPPSYKNSSRLYDWMRKQRKQYMNWKEGEKVDRRASTPFRQTGILTGRRSY